MHKKIILLLLVTLFDSTIDLSQHKFKVQSQVNKMTLHKSIRVNLIQNLESESFKSPHKFWQVKSESSHYILYRVRSQGMKSQESDSSLKTCDLTLTLDSSPCDSFTALTSSSSSSSYGGLQCPEFERRMRQDEVSKASGIKLELAHQNSANLVKFEFTASVDLGESQTSLSYTLLQQQQWQCAAIAAQLTCCLGVLRCVTP